MIGDADALVELDEVGADAKEHVLAVVYDFTGAGMLPGGSATAEEGTLLEQGDAEAGVRKAQAAASPARPPPATATVGWEVGGSGAFVGL